MSEELIATYPDRRRALEASISLARQTYSQTSLLQETGKASKADVTNEGADLARSLGRNGAAARD